MSKTNIQLKPEVRKLSLVALLFTFVQINITHAQCGKALSFDPNDDSFVYLGEGQEMIYDVENNFTIEFWIKPQKPIKTGMIAFNEQYDGWGGQNYAVFPGWYPAEEDACGVGVSVGTNGVAIIEAGAEYMPASLVHYTPISSTVWTHIAVVYSDRIPKLYINGLLAALGAMSSPKSHVYPTATAGDVSTYEGYDLGPFAGIIDEFRIWSVVFNDATVLGWYDKYTKSDHPYYSYLHTFWKFDESSGETVADASGNGHTGVVVNPPLRVAGWAPAGATIPTVSAGSDAQLYYGYLPTQCLSRTASVTGGQVPFSYTWTLDRALLSGETFSGANTETAALCLKEDAKLCIQIVDGNGCAAVDCATIQATDISCTAGSSEIPKVTICHNGVTMCVIANAVPSHLLHGDNLGKCEDAVRAFTKKPDLPIAPNIEESAFRIMPNPGKGIFQINTASTVGILRVINSSGQQVKQINLNGQQRVELSLEQAGIYYLQLHNGHQVITKKLLVTQ